MMIQDLPRAMLAIFFIGMLGYACLLVLTPFLPALVWSAMIVVATWPVLLRMQSWLRGSRSAAVTVMTLLLLMVLILPLTLLVSSLVENADQIASLPATIAGLSLPPPPQWVADIPLVGPPLAAKWQSLSGSGLSALSVHLKSHAGELARWVVGQMGSLGLLLINFMLVAVLSAILYANGETAAGGVVRFARRLAGVRGEQSVLLAAQAVRAVAMGIVLTALVQTLVGAVGLAVAGIPYVGLLTALMFVMALAQVGAGLVVLLAAGWLFWQGATGWGIFMVVWAVLVGGLDNFLRPMLIKRGADLPLLLIFAGVIGGLVSMGIIGLFIGPLVLAVTHALLVGWVKDGEAASDQH